MRERWRNVRRAPGYRVSNLGRVRSRGGVLSPWLDRDGYPRVSLCGEQVLLSHVVLEAFEGIRPYGKEALHHPRLSAGRDDCRAVVLRWGTHRENERDKRRTEEKDGLEVGTRPYVSRTFGTSDVQ